MVTTRLLAAQSQVWPGKSITDPSYQVPFRYKIRTEGTGDHHHASQLGRSVDLHRPAPLTQRTPARLRQRIWERLGRYRSNFEAKANRRPAGNQARYQGHDEPEPLNQACHPCSVKEKSSLLGITRSISKPMFTHLHLNPHPGHLMDPHVRHGIERYLGPAAACLPAVYCVQQRGRSPESLMQAVHARASAVLFFLFSSSSIFLGTYMVPYYSPRVR